MKNRKGFTLVELLAVIVILAIILVIAVPQILNTINQARLGAFRSTAKLLISQAEKDYLVKQTLGQTTSGTVMSSAKIYKGRDVSTATADGSTDEKAYGVGDLNKLSATDYADSVKITVTDGTAVLNVLEGTGKFAGYSCKNATIASIDSPENTNGCAQKALSAWANS